MATDGMIAQKVRRMVRGIRRGGEYPVALPNVNVDSGHWPPYVKLCDGTRTLRQVMREAGVGAAQVLEQHDQGNLVLWRGAAKEPSQGDVRHVILSPHPDDSALSAASVLLNCQGVMVVTVFSKTAWWRFGEGKVEEIERIRVEEEKLMARLAGARLELMGLPEALLRGHGMGEVFTAAPTLADQNVMGLIRSRIGELRARWPAARWYIPLGIGNHLDHRLVRDAALGEVASTELYGYEDLPYAAEGGSKPAGLPVDEDELFACPIRWKLELLRVYWSQFTYSRLASLQAYARKVGSNRPAERMRRFIQTSI